MGIEIVTTTEEDLDLEEVESIEQVWTGLFELVGEREHTAGGAGDDGYYRHQFAIDDRIYDVRVNPCDPTKDGNPQAIIVGIHIDRIHTQDVAGFAFWRKGKPKIRSIKSTILDDHLPVMIDAENAGRLAEATINAPRPVEHAVYQPSPHRARLN